MKLNSSKIRTISFLSLISFLTVNSLNYQYSPPKSRRKLVNVWASNIIEYFDLENKLLADEYYEYASEYENEYSKIDRDDSNGCNNLEDINSYFFRSYSGHNNMTKEQLENLISHHVNRSPRDNFTEYRSRKYRCKRKRVILSSVY